MPQIAHPLLVAGCVVTDDARLFAHPRNLRAPFSKGIGETDFSFNVRRVRAGSIRPWRHIREEMDVDDLHCRTQVASGPDELGRA
jgi:hypothetical protein